MSIRVRGKSFQVDFVREGQRYRRDFKTYQEASDAEVKAKARLLEGLDPFPSQELEPVSLGKTFGEASEEVWNLEWSKSKSASKTRSRLTIVQTDIGRDTLLKDITTDRLDQYTMELERDGNSGATINRKMSIVSKVLKHAYRREELDRMPFIPRRGEPPTRFRWYTEDEQRRILEACRENNHEEFFILMVVLFDTGMRISEALDLTLDNTDFDKNLITLHYGETKNNDARSIPMTKRVARLLEANTLHAETPVTTTKRYFTINYNQANEEWVQVRSRIGMGKGDGIHSIRHTFCSRLSQKGTDMRVIQELAGHKDLSTTQRYTHLNPDTLKTHIAKLEAVDETI